MSNITTPTMTARELLKSDRQERLRRQRRDAKRIARNERRSALRDDDLDLPLGSTVRIVPADFA